MEREKKQKDSGGVEGGREVYFNGLFCIQVVAGGFWKPLHTVTISLLKGQTQQQLQCGASDYTSHYSDHFQEDSRRLEAFQLAVRPHCVPPDTDRTDTVNRLHNNILVQGLNDRLS